MRPLGALNFGGVGENALHERGLSPTARTGGRVSSAPVTELHWATQIQGAARLEAIDHPAPLVQEGAA